MTDAPLTELETSAIDKGWLRDKPNSPRDVLLALFALCDDLNPVNYGGADEAADEVIRVLGHYGFVIVSNTPNLVPSPTAQEPAVILTGCATDKIEGETHITGEAEGLTAFRAAHYAWVIIEGRKVGDGDPLPERYHTGTYTERLVRLFQDFAATALAERDETIARLWEDLKHADDQNKKYHAKLAEAREALQEIKDIDISDKGLPSSRIARAALAAIGGKE